MNQASPWLSQEQQDDKEGQEDTIKLPAIKVSSSTIDIEKEPAEIVNTDIASIDTAQTASISQDMPIESMNTAKTASLGTQDSLETVSTISTLKLPNASPTVDSPTAPIDTLQRRFIPQGRAILLAALLFVLILNAANLGSTQFIGAQGWAYVLGGPISTGDPNLLQDAANQFHHKATPGATAQPTRQITPQEYINAIVQKMTLDEKLGQMMIVQFTGPDYGLDLSTMISQYKVGAVLIFAANANIVSKTQLKGLISQMQKNSTIPLVEAIDQEGGYVDRLVNLDGPSPSATTIGATNDPSKAMAAGIRDANDLASYGINLNLAPVVDVTNIFNSESYQQRTYGNNAALVTKMAGAYLRGLQQSGKVLGTLKHFPGLGDVTGDPHTTVTNLNRSQSQLTAIDWAPYSSLIQQGNVYAVMVTHEIVTAVDNTKPSSLSYKVITGILRNQLGFQGVIMTDSLTMEGILAYTSEAHAAALAVEAGSDLLMGASTPEGVAAMIEGIKQAINAGELSQQRIDDSVRRILMLKYQMGLIHIPTT